MQDASMQEVDESMSEEDLLMEQESLKQEEYLETLDKMFPNTKQGTLKYYNKEFLKTKHYDQFWSQPEASSYCNAKVIIDGGVGWYNKSYGGKGKGKTNPDGTPTSFGDPGRELEQIRTEKYEGCWDNKTGEKAGPFRLNIKHYQSYTGSTKSHSFSDEIKTIVTKRSGGKCELCGHKGRTEIDHFIPKEKGGGSTLENANVLCQRCNDRKCNKNPEQFMKEEVNRFFNYYKERGMEEQLRQHFTNTLSNGIS